MSTTRFSTQMTPVLTTCFLAVLVWKLLKMLTRFLEEEKADNRVLLGLSPAQTQQTSTLRPNVTSSEPVPDPLNELDLLPPEYQDVLVREAWEGMSQNPKNLTVNPEVEQIVPGQVSVNLDG